VTFQPCIRNPHAQTILGALLRNLARPLPGTAVQVPTSHGDTLHGWWVEPTAPHAGKTLVVLHGIGGNHRAGQLVTLGRAWLKRRLGPVLLFSLRGAHSSPTVPRLYHGGSSDDAQDVYTWARARSRKVVMVGLSLGANILVKWLGQYGIHDQQLELAISVSNPWDLRGCCEHMESSHWGRFYRTLMVKALRQRCLRCLEAFPGSLRAENVLRVRTFYDFDSVVTAPLHGFASAHAYYEESSASRYLDGVKAPLLCVDSLDDPFRHPAALPRTAPANVELYQTAYGGHLGYLGAGCSFWLERFICERVCDAAVPPEL
jgi:uncharacterized protein